MAAVSMLFSTVGPLLKGAGEIQSLENKAKADEFDAAVANQNATLSRQQAAEDARRIEIKGRQAQGDIRASYGASGVSMEGSPMDVLEQSASNIELDRLTALYQGDVKANSYQSQASQDSFAASSANDQKFYAAAGAIYGAASKGGLTALQLGN